MARGVNKVILLGNLGADPDVKVLENGTAVAAFNLATSEKWKDRSTGEDKERTEWHRVALFGRLAEIAGEYLKKGSKAYIEGNLRTRKWQDKEGVEHYTTEIICKELQLLDGKPADNSERQKPEVQAQVARPPLKQQVSAYQVAKDGGYIPPMPDNFDEDDIPF